MSDFRRDVDEIWDITQRREVILTNVSGQPVCPIFKGQEVLDFLTRNVGTQLPVYTA